jgi:hypothetical protein
MTLAVGDNNRITHDLENANSVAIGSSNKITSTSALAVGYNNSVNGYTAVVLGTGLETSDTQGQVVVGTYNTVNSAARFIVGNGDSSIRKTAFEVLTDGRAKVQAGPIEANDVVRKQELDTKLTKVTSTSSYSRVYAIASNGAQKTYNVSGSTILNDALAVRVTNGHLVVPMTPTADGHAVSKKYLDDKLVNLLKLIDGLTEEQLTALNKFAKNLTVGE